MKRSDLKKFLVAVLNHVDYDIAKSYDPKTAEEPDYAKEQMESLLDFAESYIKILDSKKSK